MKTIVLAMLLLVVAVPLAMAETNCGPTYNETWDGRGTDSMKCDMADDEYRNATTGWIHWVFSTKGASTDATLIVNGEAYDPAEPFAANTWHFYTPYSDLEEIEATIYLNGEPGTGGGLVISDYCPGDGDGGTGGDDDPEPIPEFPTVALPIAAILGLAFFFQRRKE